MSRASKAAAPGAKSPRPSMMCSGRNPKVKVFVPFIAYHDRPGAIVGVTYRVFGGNKLLAVHQVRLRLAFDGSVTFISKGSIPVCQRKSFKKRSTPRCSRGSLLPLIPTENDRSITSRPVAICRLAGIGMRFTAGCCWAAIGVSTEHNISKMKIVRMSCSPEIEQILEK